MCTNVNDRLFVNGFIDLYRKSTALWQTKSKKYNDRHAKLKAYEELVKYFKTVDAEACIYTVKKKINNIRCSFRKEHKKVLKSMKTKFPEEEVYKPSLWYYDLLMFTLTQDEQDATVSTDNYLSSDESDDQQEAALQQLNRIAMKITQATLLAIRLSYTQHRSPDRAVFRSAAALAATGIALSSFSLKQMLENQRRRF